MLVRHHLSPTSGKNAHVAYVAYMAYGAYEAYVPSLLMLIDECESLRFIEQVVNQNLKLLLCHFLS